MNSTKICLLILGFMFSGNALFAQKVIIVGANYSNATTRNDGVSFVVNIPLVNGDVIYITENEYNATSNVFDNGGGATADEGVIKFVANTSIAKGQVITLRFASPATVGDPVPVTVACTGGTCGTATFPNLNNNINYRTGGESIYAYSDNDDNPLNGVTEIYSVFYPGAESANNGGGNIPANESPLPDFPNAIVVDGFTWTGVTELNLIEFTPATRSSNVSKATVENPSNYTQTSNPALNPSTTVFASLNLSGTNPVITLATSTTSIVENAAGTITFTFTLSANAASNITVNFNVTGSATFGTDYTQSGAASFTTTAGTITIPSGSNTASFTIDPTGDGSLEPDETVIITSVSGTGYDAGNPSARTVTITNDDTGTSLPKVALVGISHADISTNPTHLDGFSFVALDDLASGTVVYFTRRIYDKTTLVFTSLYTGTVKWTAGTGVNRGDVYTVVETSADVFTVTCSDGSSCGTITNLDAGFSIPTTGVTMFAYSDNNDIPTDAVTEIYSALHTGDLVAFTNGGAIPVNSNPSTVYPNAVVVDNFPNANPGRTEYKFPTERQVTVSRTLLTNVANWLHAQSTATAPSTVRFTNIIVTSGVANPLVTVTASPSSVLENSGSGITYTFTLSQNAASNMTINFGVSGTATFTTDYTQTGATSFTASTGSVVIPSGSNSANVTIIPVAETTLEPNETVILTIDAGTGYDAGNPNVATGTINNDDVKNVNPLVVIVGMNHGNNSNIPTSQNPDGFSFAANQNLTAGTDIYFIDGLFNNTTLSFNTPEAVVKYTVPTGGLAKGQVVYIVETGATTNVFTVSCSAGSNCGTATYVTQSVATDFSFASSGGDNLYAYTDTDGDPGNGITDVHSLFYAINSSIPTIQNPTTVFPNAVVITGFGSASPDRTEYKFAASERSSPINLANIQNTANYLIGQATQGLSVVPFAALNLCPASITTSPSNVAICAGANTTFTVVAAGSNLTYQWQVNSGAGFTNINDGGIYSGATSATLTLTNVPIGNNGFTYQCVVNACATTNVATLTVNASPTATASSNSPVCLGSTINLTGGAAGNTYLWSGPNSFTSTDQNPTIASVTAAAAGVYTIRVTNANSCTSTATTSVTVNALPTAIASSSTPVICAGSNISLTGGGVGTYLWSGPNTYTSTAQSPTIANATVLASGVYTIRVTNANNCTSTATTSVTVNAGPTATASSNSPVCAGATINLTGGASGNTYLWTGPNSFTSTDQSPSIANATTAATGTYTIRVSDGSCTSTATTSVTVNPLPTATASSNSPVCIGNNLNLMGGGVGTYAWAGPNSFTSTAQSPTIANATALASGTYTITVTNANNCTSTATTAVTMNAVPTATASNSTPTICEGSSISLIGGGGGTYLWSGPNGYTSTAQSPTILNATIAASGTYTITVTGAGNCTSTATTSVTVNNVPFASANSNSPICAGATLNLNSGSEGNTYLWTGPNSFTSTELSPSIANATTLATGTYTIMITNAGNCTSMATVAVTVNAVPTATANSNSPICSGETLELLGGGEESAYLWTGPNSFSSSAQNPTIPNATVTASGTYTLAVTSMGNCTATTTIAVTVNGIATATVTPSTQTICSGGAITTIAITGNGTSYTWTRNNTTSATGIAASGSGEISGSLTNTANTPLTVTFTITPVGTCNGTPITATVIVNPIPTATASTPSQTICSGALISGITLTNLTGGNTSNASDDDNVKPKDNPKESGGITFGPSVAGTVFNWTRDNTATVTSTTIGASGSGNISGRLTNTTTSPVTVTFTITPSYTNAGTTCIGTPITVTVTVNPNPASATITDAGTAFCSGSSTTLSAPADPNYTYAWERSSTGIATPNEFTAFGGTAQTQVITTSGVYRAIVTNQYNCSARDTTAVKFGNIVFSGSLGTGDAQQTGRIFRDAIASTCASPKTFPGTLETSGARYYDSYTITNPSNSPVCATIGLTSGCGTSLFSVAYLGSYNPTSLGINYLADHGSSFPGTGFYEATIPANGTIVVVVHEISPASGCSNYNLRIDVPGATVAPTASSNSPICAGNTLNLTGTGTGTYAWTGPNSFTSSAQNPTIPNATVSATGTYTISVTNTSGCVFNATTAVTVNAIPTATASSNSPICAGNTVSLTGGGIGTYLWTGPNGYSSTAQNPTISNATVSSTGTYTITVTNANSCTSTATVAVTVNATPTATASSSTPVICAGNNISLTGGGIGTYLWAGPNGYSSTAQSPTISNATVSATGTYTIRVTNVSGCTSTASVAVTVNATPTATASSSTPVICAGNSISLTGGGIGTYLWTGPNGYSSTAQSPTISNATVSATGTYTITVTNANSCTSTATVAVTVNATPTATASSSTPVICAGNNISLTGGGIGTYLWAGPNGYSSTAQSPTISNATVSATGTYTITVTNVSGCTSTATTSVTVNALPTATASSNSPICVGNTISLTGGGVGTYLWTGPNAYSSTAQSPTISNAIVSASGTYTITVTNANNCTSTATVAVTVNANPSATASSNSPICAGNTLSLTGGGVGTYLWAGPNGYSSTAQSPTISNATVSATGTYTITVTNVSGCTSAATVSVTINAIPTATASTSTPSICAGTSVSLTGGGVGTYAWTGPNSYISTAQSPTITSATILASGIYKITVTNVNGCTSTATTSVTVNPLPVVDAGANQTICEGSTASLTATCNLLTVSTILSGASEVPANISTATGTVSGTFDKVTKQLLLTISFNGLTANASAAHIHKAAVGVNGGVVIGFSGVPGVTTGSFTYTGTLTTTQEADLLAGLYYVNVHNANFPGGEIRGQLSTACVANNFVWNPGNLSGQTVTVSPSAAQLYTVTASNTTTGCSSTATTTVNVNPRPVPTIGSNTPVCAGNTLNLTVSVGSSDSPSTFAWVGPNSFASTAQNPSIASAMVSASGTYTVTVTNVNGCINTATTAVVINALPTATASNNSPICSGVTLQLTGGGIGTYSWNGPSGYTSSQQSPSIPSATASMSGTYTILVTNVNGCTSTATTSVTVNPVVVIPTPQANTQIIFGASITLTATGCSGVNDVLKWYQSADNALATMPVSPTATTNYYAKCETTLNGITCISGNSSDVTVTVLQPNPPVATGATNCLGTPTTLTATGCSGSVGTFVLKWYQNADDALVTMPVSPSTTTDYYAKCEQTFNAVTAVSAKSNVVTLTILNPPTPVSTGGTIYNGQSISLTATGCTGTLGTFTLKWYQTADNVLVTMPVSPTVTTQYYSKCEQTANSVTCLSAKSNDVTVTVVNRIFVDITKIAAPIQNGNSWATAYGNLQTGLAAATAGVEVWVAKGTYKPTNTVTRTIYFNIPNSVKVYGGFAGTEDNLIERNFRTNVTILSGDIGTDKLATDNSYHVVVLDGSSNTTVLNGFTISDGYANFDPNRTYLAPNTLAPTTATIETGGGIVVQNAGMPTIANCTLINNSAVTGGGLYASDASMPTIMFCKFMANQAGFGSGMYFQDGSSGKVSNTLISGNRGIGGVYNNNSSPMFTNVTFAGNGGYNGGIFNSNSQPVVKNSIIWGNSTPFNDTQSIITYSTIQGGYAGVGNLSMDPKFVSLTPEGLSPILSGDYHVQASSLTIDRGDNGIISLTDKDLDGNLRRFAGGRVDMGTYEFQGVATATLVISVATGNWESNSTWDVGRVPQLGDYVIIDSNHIVTLNGTGIAKNLEYRGTGQLKFNTVTSKLEIGF